MFLSFSLLPKSSLQMLNSLGSCQDLLITSKNVIFHMKLGIDYRSNHYGNWKTLKISRRWNNIWRSHCLGFMIKIIWSNYLILFKWIYLFVFTNSNYLIIVYCYFQLGGDVSSHSERHQADMHIIGQHSH